MSKIEGPKSWYALQVMTGQEESVKAILDKQEIGSIRLLIYRRRLRERKQGQWHMVERKLFPGYILMEAYLTDDLWQRMNATEASFRILKNDDTFLTLKEGEIETLGLIDPNEDGLIDITKIYKDGDAITVVSGPLSGQEARIVSVNKRKGRAKVRLGFCGQERIIELGIEVIEKC